MSTIDILKNQVFNAFKLVCVQFVNWGFTNSKLYLRLSFLFLNTPQYDSTRHSKIKRLGE